MIACPRCHHPPRRHHVAGLARVTVTLTCRCSDLRVLEDWSVFWFRFAAPGTSGRVDDDFGPDTLLRGDDLGMWMTARGDGQAKVSIVEDKPYRTPGLADRAHPHVGMTELDFPDGMIWGILSTWVPYGDRVAEEVLET